MSDEKDYEVGYGKPPKETQFKKGRSGNPRGRPYKKPETFGTLFEKELKTTLIITEGNGKRKRVPKADAIVKQLVNKAVGGDHRSTTLLFKFAGALDPKATEIKTFRPQTEEERLRGEEDHRYIMEKLLRYSATREEERKREEEREKNAAEVGQTKLNEEKAEEKEEEKAEEGLDENTDV